MVQDLWVWDNKVDAMAALLEERITAEVKRASRTATSAENDDHSEEQAMRLKVVAGDASTTTSPEEANTTTTYDLTTLLSSETLASITNHVAHAVTEGVWKVQGPQAWRVRLAIDKLQSYRSSNEIQKQLPMVQHPAGSRQQKLSKLRAGSEESKDES